jgi:hypothetical protein
VEAIGIFLKRFWKRIDLNPYTNIETRVDWKKFGGYKTIDALHLVAINFRRYSRALAFGYGYWKSSETSDASF